MTEQIDKEREVLATALAIMITSHFSHDKSGKHDFASFVAAVVQNITWSKGREDANAMI